VRNRRVLGSGFWRVLGPLGGGALLVFFLQRTGDIGNLVYKVFLGRALSTLDFGAVDPVFSVLALLSLPVAILFQVAVKSLSRLRAMESEAQSRALVADMVKVSALGSLAALLVVFFARDLILSRLHLDGTVYVVVIGLLFVVALWQPLLGAILQGQLRYRMMLITPPLKTIVLIGLVLLFVGGMDLGLLGALIARAAASIVALLVMFFFIRSSVVGPHQSYATERRVMFGTLLPMTVYLCSLALLFHFNRLFVRNFLLSDSGGYGAVVTWGTIPAYFISPIAFVLFPLASAEHAGGRKTHRFFRQAVALSLGITAGCSLVLAIGAEPLMRRWNPDFVPYAKYVWLYGLSMGLHGTIQIVSSAEMARNRYRFLWFLCVPAVVMCAVLYAGRSDATVLSVLMVVAATHGTVLLAYVGVGWARRLLSPKPLP